MFEVIGESIRSHWGYVEAGKDNVDELEPYRCTVCGWVYYPDEGDRSNGIDPGTPFEELPDDFCCIVCGVGKEFFEEGC